MTNFQVYKKTLPFSFILFGLGLVSFAVMVGCCVAGYFIAGGSATRALIGLAIGFVVGIIFAVAFDYLVLNRIKAAQIAMMTKGVADDKLPDDHIVQAGFAEVKGRFAKITAFFFVTGVIKSMFRQIGRLTTRVGSMIGGQAGESVGSAIDSAVQILLGYLCDCCLGWVMYRKDVGVTKAACEGAVIFFKSGKTLFRNIGRIFGMGAVSLLVVGGALFGGFYAVTYFAFPNLFIQLSEVIKDAAASSGGTVPDIVSNPSMLGLFACLLAAVIIWSMIHGVVGRPFILVGVLRNFVAVGKQQTPSEADFKELEKRSPKIARLRQKLDAR